MTVRSAAERLLAGARDGTVRNRSGDRFKPSVIRSYEASLRLHVLPELGGARLGDVRRRDVQDLADRLLSRGLDPSSVRNAVMPLRVLYRRAIARSDVSVNPTHGLELPAVRGRRERIASPREAADLLAAVPTADRPVWTTAMYAGLRLGELRALTWGDVDLERNVIRVRRSWDPVAGPVEPKSRAGVRSVPLSSAVRRELVEHRLRQGDTSGLVFGRTATRPFDPSTVVERTRRAWRDASLDPIGLHDCRHTFASLMIAAGVNAKGLSTYMGHAGISITLDRYGHLMPGNEAEAAERFDAYLARGTEGT